ncbi:MAG: TIGR02266 family protein [Thermodesulfobacteriota bacterium]
MSPHWERRRHSRKSCRLRVRLRGCKELQENYIKDLGKGGVFVETLYPFRIGTYLELELLVGDDPRPLKLPGEVVWVRPGHEGGEPGMGVRFLEISDQTLERINGLLDQQDAS